MGWFSNSFINNHFYCWVLEPVSWKYMQHSPKQIILFLPFFKILFIFNWRRIALQYCFGFCHMLNLEPIIQSEVSQKEENKAEHSLKMVVIYLLHWLDIVEFQWKSDRRGNVYSICSHFWMHKKHCLGTLRSACGGQTDYAVNWSKNLNK